MHMLTPTTVLVRAPDIIASDMDGDTVMMSIERGEYLGMGEVGTRVWRLLEQPNSIQEIARQICLEFTVDETTCQADILAFADELIQNGLIRKC